MHTPGIQCKLQNAHLSIIYVWIYVSGSQGPPKWPKCLLWPLGGFHGGLWVVIKGYVGPELDQAILSPKIVFRNLHGTLQIYTWMAINKNKRKQWNQREWKYISHIHIHALHILHAPQPPKSPSSPPGTTPSLLPSWCVNTAMARWVAWVEMCWVLMINWWHVEMFMTWCVYSAIELCPFDLRWHHPWNRSIQWLVWIKYNQLTLYRHHYVIGQGASIWASKSRICKGSMVEVTRFTPWSNVAHGRIRWREVPRYQKVSQMLQSTDDW